MRIIEDLQWRYATKKFDPTKKVTDAVVEKILEAGNLTATSFGMQAYRFLLVEKEELKAQLASCSWGKQLQGASHVIVLAACTDVDDSFTGNYVDFMTKVRNLEAGKLDSMKEMIIGFIKRMDESKTKMDWAARQTYIVLGTLMAACAEARVDSCPMEGIDKAKYDEILELKSKKLTTVSALPIGYRAAEDYYQDYIKVRRPLSEMVIKYQ